MEPRLPPHFVAHGASTVLLSSEEPNGALKANRAQAASAVPEPSRHSSIQSSTVVVPMELISSTRLTPRSRKGSVASTFSHYTSVASRRLLADRRVIKFGLSLPIIFLLSAAIGVTYTAAYLADSGTNWMPGDLTGDDEWTSFTRTHLVQNPVELLDELLQPSVIGVDTSVSVNFLNKYGTANEGDVQSTAATFNKTWLDAQFILTHGFAIAGQMAGSFEGYGSWPCALAIAKHPVIAAVCPDPQTDWFGIQIYNNLVATSSEKASAYLSLTYTPMTIMTARIWTTMKPELVDDGVVVKGYKQGTYTERVHFLLKLEQGQLALAKVEACNRATQSNALECDRLENEGIYVRNYAKRDFEPLHKLDKIQVYGPAYALGNYVAADKNFVQFPATAVMMTDTGYSATVRFVTTFPFRLTIRNSKLTCEYSIPQVARYTQAVGKSFAAGAIQMIVVCMIVLNAVAHCRASGDVVAREGKIFRFRNFITTGIVARRLGTYKIVSVQLCIYHALNVQTYFAAVYYSTETVMDTFAFASEGVLLMVVFTMLLDQVIFFERYSSVRETLTVLASCGMYFLALHLNRTYFLWREQVQVTELARCARANTCYIIHGLRYYYVGLAVSLLVPVVLVNGPIHWFLVSTRASYPRDPVASIKLTSFEKFCVGMDARLEFGDFERGSLGTPISIVHAAGFTYVGSYLVRVKDYYMVVIARYAPEVFIKSCGLTISVFRVKDGKVVAGRHMLLGAAYKLFREKHCESNYHTIQ